ncbi:hypothetical protein Hanom_Chr10g00920291 [Helianthus anomalus]
MDSGPTLGGVQGKNQYPYKRPNTGDGFQVLTENTILGPYTYRVGFRFTIPDL